MRRADAPWRAVAGTRYRALTSLVVLGYGSLALATAALLAFSGREAVYRVSASTEQFSAQTTRPLRIGATAVDVPGCGRAALELPPGGEVQGRRRAATAQTYVVLTAPAGASVDLRCERGQRLALPAVTLPAPEAARAGGDDAEAPRIAFRVSGRMAIGGVLDDDTPAAAAPLLRSARIVAEVAEWPGDALVPVSERTIEGGGRLTFRRGPDGDEPAAEGLVTMTAHAFQLHLRFAGRGLLYTAPGAERGSEIVVAPGFFDRIKAQAQFGVWVVLASLVLGLLEALRAFESAPARARRLAGDPPSPGEAHD